MRRPSTRRGDGVPWIPTQVRMKMYEELAEEKAEKENRELRRQPRERDHAGEQRKKVERVRQREEEGKILQCNEGKWEFHFDEESVKGSIILDLHVSRHLDSSLIDLDIHPAYVSVVIKSKVLRLKLPSEVNASLSTAKRSKVTDCVEIILRNIACRGHGDNVASMACASTAWAPDI